MSIRLICTLALFWAVLIGPLLPVDSRAMQEVDHQPPDLVILYSSDTRANVECKG